MNTKLSLLLLSVAFTGAIYAEGATETEPAPAPAPAAEEGGREGKGGRMGGLLKQHDTNKDGILQAAEIDAAKSDKVKEKLKALDANKDGDVDAAELEAGKKAMKDKHGHEGHDHGPEKKDH